MWICASRCAARSPPKPKPERDPPAQLMFAKLHPTLKQVFAFSLLGLFLSLTLLFWLISYGSQKTILKGSDNLRDVTSGEVTRQIVEYLHEAPIAVAYFEKQVQHSLVDPDKPDSIQKSLLSL